MTSTVSTGLRIDGSCFKRSGLHLSRRKTKSERTSSSKHCSLPQNICSNEEEEVEIYFNSAKRNSFFKNVIDNYFVPHQKLIGDEALFQPVLPRKTATSDSKRCKRTQIISISRIKLKNRSIAMDFNLPTDIHSLPIIEQGSSPFKRPISEHKPKSQQKLSNIFPSDKDIDESLFIESNKSFIDPSNQSQTMDQPSSYKFVTVRRGGKKFGKTRIFNSNTNEQLLREQQAKKLGVQLLWTQSINQNSLQYPIYKNLRELCYSSVQENNGEEPVLLIYPTPYYYSLFVNDNEELIDIIVAMAKIVAKGQGNIANNQINISNIVKMKEKKFYLADWGCAALRESVTINGRTFTKDLNPICRDDNKWTLSPEYLSPQMLRATQSGYYQHIWRQKGGLAACDIWSIGCLIYEIIMLLPMTSPYYCAIKGKQQRKRSVFGSKIRASEKILAKQRNFKGFAVRSIREEMKYRKQLRISEKILQILPKMLEQSPYNRITAEQILMKLR